MDLHRLSLAAALAAAAGCSTNQSGDFATSRTGDLSHPLAERRAPDEELIAACGDGAVSTDFAPAIHRAPYLQQLGERSTHVLWTEDDGAPPRISVTQPDGAAVGPVRATSVVDGVTVLDGDQELRSVVDNLEPDTIYCYTLTDETRAATAPAGFRTAPAPGSGARVSFVAFGDSGHGGEDQFAILDQLNTVPFRFMLHTGDIAYESGTLGQLEETYFDVYAPLLRSFAMFPSIGNHDDHSVFRDAFDLPLVKEAYYSFDQGDVHFVALDTTRISEEQAAWLEDDLSRTTADWIIAYGHHPPYSSGDHGSTTAFRDTFGPILEAHQVDLVLSGHDHDYERIAAQNGVHYVVTGGGGRGTRPVGSSSWTEFAEQVLHFVYVEIDGDQLLLHAIDGEGTEFDQLLIQH